MPFITIVMIPMPRRTLGVCLNRKGNQLAQFEDCWLIFILSVWQPLLQCPRYGVNKLESALSPLVKIGLKSVLIFGVPTKANKVGHS